MHTPPPLHDALTPLAGLIGTWRGSGHGDYPTIEPFDYTEEVTFAHVGKPFLRYEQRTRHAETGAGLHAEVGYLRVVEDGRVEWVLAHPTGITEIEEGVLAETEHGAVLDLAATSVEIATTAVDVRDLRRKYVLAGDVVQYDLWMATADVPMTHHLRAELRRVSDP